MLVLIGLGSNRGDSLNTMRGALQRLGKFARPGTFVASRMWRTSPVDCPPDAGDFVNAVACFEASDGIEPEALLQDLKALAREFGRDVAYVRYAPRELDLDLLLFGEEQRNNDAFTLPHPRAVNRRFVLAPAAEIVPGLIWPGTDKTIAELLDELQSDEQVEPL